LGFTQNALFISDNFYVFGLIIKRMIDSK